MGWGGGINEAPYGPEAGHASADEYCCHDGQARASLRDVRVQGKRDPEWHGGQGIAEVMDQVSQQSDAAARDKHDGLSYGGEPEDGKRQRDGPDAGSGAP